MSFGLQTSNVVYNLQIRTQGEIVILIQPDGRIFWKGREVETDEEYRKVVIEMLKLLSGVK